MARTFSPSCPAHLAHLRAQETNQNVATAYCQQLRCRDVKGLFFRGNEYEIKGQEQHVGMWTLRANDNICLSGAGGQFDGKTATKGLGWNLAGFCISVAA